MKARTITTALPIVGCLALASTAGAAERLRLSDAQLDAVTAGGFVAAAGGEAYAFGRTTWSDGQMRARTHEGPDGGSGTASARYVAIGYGDNPSAFADSFAFASGGKSGYSINLDFHLYRPATNGRPALALAFSYSGAYTRGW